MSNGPRAKARNGQSVPPFLLIALHQRFYNHFSFPGSQGAYSELGAEFTTESTEATEEDTEFLMSFSSVTSGKELDRNEPLRSALPHPTQR